MGTGGGIYTGGGIGIIIGVVLLSSACLCYSTCVYVVLVAAINIILRGMRMNSPRSTESVVRV